MLVELFVVRLDPDRPREGAGGEEAGGREGRGHRAARRGAGGHDPDRGGARRGGEPRRGPDPAQLHRSHSGDAPHQLLPARPGRDTEALPLVQARPAPDPRAARAAADVRDIRLLAAGGGGASARRRRRARRHPLVGPARGLPHRGAGAREGPAGEERGDRAGRLEGRLRAQAAAGRGRGARRSRRRGSSATGSSFAACST